MSELKLGDLVRCTVTDYKGTIVIDSHYLNGCRRLGVQPKVMADGKIPETIMFDEQQLELVTASAVPNTPVKTGGPIYKAPHHG